MKTTIYTFNNTKKTNNADYSKILDSIIANTLIKNNKYLFKDAKKKETDHKSEEDALIDALFDDMKKCNNTSLKGDIEFAKACAFLANYGKNKKSYTIPYKLNTLYRLADGTPIIFYDDEIQIGTDLYEYADFDNLDFINSLKPETKKLIINIKIKL